jgi:pseudouridine-5'-phosphate glycosidase
MFEDTLKLSGEVTAARGGAKPIVALESTVIAHGLPWPSNLETACQAESAVRDAGAVPATIAVIDGEIHAGLGRQELERLARGADVYKASSRDLPWLVATRRTAATTVAATLFVAHRAGIPIMATGGIGGVHRGADETCDVSADLIELARTPVAVVCSGAKSILDLPRTLEFLETHGVAVVGCGTHELPAFFSPSSGQRLNCRVDSPAQAAELIRSGRRLAMPSGIVIANPPPAEHAIPRDELERITRQSVAAAATAGVRGKALTPYLLDQLRQLGGERILAVNRALVVANARLAARIAAAL